MDKTEYVWSISDFCDLLNKEYKEQTGESFTAHRNTIEKWFKELEAQKVHYIKTKNDKRMYDWQDLQIGIKVMDMRSKGVKMHIIGETLPKLMEMREFPDNYEQDHHEVSLEVAERRFNEYIDLLTEQMKQVTASKEEIIDEVLKKLESRNKLSEEEIQSIVKKALPAPISEEDKRKEQHSLMEEMLQYRLTREDEAIAEWNKLPREERTIKVGMFGRRIEDTEKRDKFIRAFLQGSKASDNS